MNWNHPHTLSRRAFAASGFVWAVFLVLGGAFFRLQVLGSDQYAVQSRNNQYRPIALPAPRGIIVDRNGVVLATNVPSFTISLLAPNETAFRAVLDSIAQYAPLDAEKYRTRCRVEPLPHPALCGRYFSCSAVRSSAYRCWDPISTRFSRETISIAPSPCPHRGE